MMELPPRARRILLPPAGGVWWVGTTSACAENTAENRGLGLTLGNYLRVRGEYPLALADKPIKIELPPRARRILTHPGGLFTNRGTTSACAENTGHAPQLRNLNRNYLRVRGEYSDVPARLMRVVELPPRARRIPTPC